MVGLMAQAYFDRAEPRFAVAKVLASTLALGLVIERGPGSNCPWWGLGLGWPALALRLCAFFAAFAFALWRALALVMFSTVSLNRHVPDNRRAHGKYIPVPLPPEQVFLRHPA